MYRARPGAPRTVYRAPDRSARPARGRHSPAAQLEGRRRLNTESDLGMPAMAGGRRGRTVVRMGHRLSSADAAWLHMDRPNNLMVINSVLLFEEPVDWERAKQVTQRRLVDQYPRFRERVVESSVPLRGPRWEPDPDFALEHHMHHLALPAPGGVAELQALVGDLMTVPLDHNRPLWHSYLVDGYGSGAAMIIRMHHCIADGIALARVMLSLTDTEPDAGIAPHYRGWRMGRSRLLVGGVPVPGTRPVKTAIDLGGLIAREGLHLVTSPSHARHVAGLVARDGLEALKLLFAPTDAPTAVKGEPRVSRRVAWTTPLPLEEIKQVAHANDATVNDVLLAAVAGGLRHYLQGRGSQIGDVQALVPYNLRPLNRPIPRELGNRFGLVLVPLPVSQHGRFRRLVEVSRRMGEIKNSRAAPVSYEILSAAGAAPLAVEEMIVDLFSGKGSCVLTNVPGPREIVYFAGTAVRKVLVWAPTSGHIGMSISIFSYRGEVTVGLMVDAAMVPDPDRVVAEFERELGELVVAHPVGTGAQPVPGAAA